MWSGPQGLKGKFGFPRWLRKEMHFSHRVPKARGRHRLKCIIANLAALAQGLIKTFGFSRAVLRHCFFTPSTSRWSARDSQRAVLGKCGLATRALKVNLDFQGGCENGCIFQKGSQGKGKTWAKVYSCKSGSLGPGPYKKIWFSKGYFETWYFYHKHPKVKYKR